MTELNEFSWNDLNGTLEVITIMSAAEIKTKKIYTSEFIEDLLEENADKIEWLMKEIVNSEGNSKDFNRSIANAKSFSLESLKKELEEEKAKREGNSSSISTRDEKNESGEKNTNSELKKSNKSSIEITREMIVERLMTLKNYAKIRKPFFNVLYSNPETRFGILMKALGSGLWAKFFKAVLTDKLLAWILK